MLDILPKADIIVPYSSVSEGKEVCTVRVLYVAGRTEQDQEGQFRSFDYFLLTEEAVAGETVIGESYGVRITSSAGGTMQESSSMMNVTASTQRINELMELLVRQCVTPISLKDVVEDWLSA